MVYAESLTKRTLGADGRVGLFLWIFLVLVQTLKRHDAASYIRARKGCSNVNTNVMHAYTHKVYIHRYIQIQHTRMPYIYISIVRIFVVYAHMHACNYA